MKKVSIQQKKMFIAQNWTFSCLFLFYFLFSVFSFFLIEFKICIFIELKLSSTFLSNSVMRQKKIPREWFQPRYFYLQFASFISVVQDRRQQWRQIYTFNTFCSVKLHRTAASKMLRQFWSLSMVIAWCKIKISFSTFFQMC